jgi:hypothetical protein
VRVPARGPSWPPVPGVLARERMSRGAAIPLNPTSMLTRPGLAAVGQFSAGRPLHPRWWRPRSSRLASPRHRPRSRGCTGQVKCQLGEQTNNPASCLCHTPCPDCRRGPGGLPGVPARVLRAAGDRRFAGQAHVPGAPRTEALFSRGCGATGAGSASAPARAACRAFLRRPASLVLRAASSRLKTWTCSLARAPGA